jgi:hypothetical protein
MQEIAKKPLFPLGRIVSGPGALAALAKAGQRWPAFAQKNIVHERSQGTHRRTGDRLRNRC